ncbi:4-hydroxy-tetrahydrodipicolinate synthase [Enemella sp. A6]|uniref:4-hydroxy-tetrahydrodipicolinate synthase n=1 Tax=Enemella sp. A6 TaxID=3440152 RepID=UPI003EB82857
MREPDPALPFGRLLTAMVTPFAADGSVDLSAARRLAAHLVDQQHNDALVINGTTGEAPTTTDAEKRELIAAVVDEIGDRAQVVAGVGTFNTDHSVHLAREAAEAGANGLLVVTPYYSKPPQEGLREYFETVASAGELPVMIYDIPGRTGTEVSTDTLIALAEHPQIVAVKDAKGNPVASATVMAATDLAYYAGDDAITPSLMAVGGVGLVGTSTHFSGAVMARVIADYAAGRIDEALTEYRRVLPVLTGVFATQGCSMVKAGLDLLGLPGGPLRPPMVSAAPDLVAVFGEQLAAAGLR